MWQIQSLIAASALLLAPLAASTGDPATVLVNYGGLGLAFALVIFGRLRTPQEVATLNKQVDVLTKMVTDRDETIRAKDSVLEALSQALSKQAIPAMAEQSRVLEAIPDQQSALAALLRESLAKTEALTARLGDVGEKGS